jgi:hypothetical protein
MSEKESEKKTPQKTAGDPPPASEDSSKKAIMEKIGQAEIDPFAQMFQFYDSFAKSWSNVMSETVSSQSFAESMGRQLEGSLDTMTLLRKQMGDLMEQYLQQMSLPSRKEVISIAKRLNRIEILLDDLDAKIDMIMDLLKEKKG